MLARTVLASIAVVSAIASCRSSGDRASADEISTPSELEYVLRVSKVPAPRVAIELDCAGSSDGVAHFGLSEDSGGVIDVGAWIEELRATGANGRALAVDHPDRSRWIVHASANERIHLAYAIGANARRMDPDPRVHYGPIVDRELVHLLGSLALLSPEHLEDRERSIAWRWEGLDATGWTACGVRGPGAGPFRVRARPEELRNAPFVAGEIDVRTIDVHGAPLHVAVARAGTSFDPDAFAKLATRVVELERGFFEDWRSDGFLISVVSIGDPGATGAHAQSIGGTGLVDSFALYLQAGTKLDDPSPGMTIPALLAHELFHAWNGAKLAFDETPQTSYWFSEGFTEFFARRLQHRGGFLDDEAYVASLNRSIAEYFQSPALHAPAAEIRERFFTDRTAGAHPYRRGDVIAFVIDQELRKRSAGTQTLDDWMRDLVLRGTRGERISPVRFYALLAERSDTAFAERVRACAEDGAVMELPRELASPCHAVELVPLPTYELGFDVEASRASGRVAGVRDGSAAHVAGLRNGQRIAGFSISGQDVSTPVRATVIEAGVKRELEWLPHGAPITIPQIVRRDHATSAGCSGL